MQELETINMGRSPPDGRIFDVHTHAFPDKVAATAIPKLEAGGLWLEAKATFDGTIGGLLASMDRAGIARAIVCSVATRPEQVAKITAWSASIASDLPAGQAGRIVPFPSVHPDSPSPEAEVERIAAAGLKGLKFHPQYTRCPLDDPRVIRLARAAAGAGLAMLFHAGYDLAYEKDDLASPARVRRLHEAVPDLRMAAAHLGGWECWDQVLAEEAGLPIYLETSYTLGRCPPGLLERILAKHPPEFLLFGTDAPWTDQKEELAKFMALPIAEDLWRRMLWDNALRFVGMTA
jgi:hypothetical protein